jgi:hypothetical protein
MIEVVDQTDVVVAKEDSPGELSANVSSYYYTKILP